MTRPNYFDVLDVLSKNACEAVGIACGYPYGTCGQNDRKCDKKSDCNKKGNKERLSFLRCECDRTICSIEDALFSDFIPPLQRDNIASLAHGFARIINRASEHYNAAVSSPYKQGGVQENEEERLCVILAEKLSQNTSMLRQIRNPEKMPSLTEFRATLRQAGEAHNAYLSKIGTGTVPRSCAMRAFSTARLRFEISRCFDGLIEVMLGNI